MTLLPYLALLALQNPQASPPAPPPGLRPPAALKDDPALLPGIAPQAGSLLRQALAPSAEKPWIPYDRVMMVVNQDIITERQLWRDLARTNHDHPLKDDSEKRAAQEQILTERVKARLSVQAGQDLGLDEKLVDRNVQDRMQRIIDSKNGVASMAKFLEEKDMTPQEMRTFLREEIYSSVWQDSVTGDAAGGGRPKCDRFVRPGMLTFHYNNVVQKPEAYAALGGKPESFVLQMLLLDVDHYGGAEAAAKLADELKKRIEGGEDMGALVDQYSVALEKKGVLEPADLGTLTRTDVRVAEFASKAKTGDVSPAIPFQGKSKSYLRLMRLLDHTPAVKPDITNTEVQSKIMKNARKDLEDYRLGKALQVLLRASYVWPKELNQQ
jgi:hypothetical protein